MSSKEDYAKPDTSQSLEGSPSTSKGVRWDSGVKDNDRERKNSQKREQAMQKSRRQSLVGTSGYVSQLLTEHLLDDSERSREEAISKPIRKQSVQERRASIKAVEADMEYYMKEASFPRAKRSSNILKFLPTTSADSVPEQEQPAIPLPDDVRPDSKWKPSNILEEGKVGVQQETSWVGTYIVGKDYWTEEKEIAEDEPKEVRYTMDTDKISWYDMSLQGEKVESKLRTLKSRSQSKIDTLKNEMDEEYEQKRKQRTMFAASARQTPAMTVEWSNEFKDCFKEISKTNNFSHSGTHISMPDADKWLEKAGIIDHYHVTLIHTGLCFLASGGNRHRGLNFDDFIYFLEMISNTCGKPLKDVARRLTACQRDPDYVLE